MPKSAYVFDFEQPIRELEDRYHHLRKMAEEDKMDLDREIKSAREKIDAKIQEVYNNLSSWQKVQISRHPQRPYALDYIENTLMDCRSMSLEPINILHFRLNFAAAMLSIFPA